MMFGNGQNLPIISYQYPILEFLKSGLYRGIAQKNLQIWPAQVFS